MRAISVQQMITAKELRDILGRHSAMQVIDVRSPAEYASGHVPGATNIPMEQLEARLDDVAQEVVLVCQAGTRATISAGWIREQRKAMVLEGGTETWQRAGYPL